MPSSTTDDLKAAVIKAAANEELAVTALNNAASVAQSAAAAAGGAGLSQADLDGLVAMLNQANGDLQARLAGQTVTPPSGGTGGGVGGSTDTNAYPFALPQAYLDYPDNGQSATGGALVPPDLDLGAGPQRIDLYMSSNPASGFNNDVAVVINGVDVLEKFRVKGFAGAGIQNDMHLILRGPWGLNPKVTVLGVATNGINSVWINSVTLNIGTTLVCNGLFDSRGNRSVNAPGVFMTNGNSVDFTLPIAVAATGGGTSGGAVGQGAVATSIDGAKVNGSPAPAGTLDALIALVPDNGTLELPAGRFIGASQIAKAITIKGQGQGVTTLDCTGFRPFQDKALLVPAVPGVNIQDLSITGARISDALGADAAGVRDAGPGIGFTLTNVETYGNQNGILTFPSDIVLNNCHMHDNGDLGSAHDLTHDAYINGAVDSTVRVNGGIYERCLAVHAFKSRAGNTIADGATFSAGGRGAALDVPWGGNVTLSNGTLRMPPGIGDTLNMITFGLETPRWSNLNLSLKNETWDDPLGTAILQGCPGAKLTIENCTYNGPNPPPMPGWDVGAVTGAFIKAPA